MRRLGLRKSAFYTYVGRTTGCRYQDVIRNYAEFGGMQKPDNEQ